MPLNNDILGIYKAVYIYTSGVAVSYIVDSVTRSVSMEASPKVMMTGSPKTRIMDLGGVTETISIQAPILIGGGASADGRALLSYKINEIIDTSSQKSGSKSGSISNLISRYSVSGSAPPFTLSFFEPGINLISAFTSMYKSFISYV